MANIKSAQKRISTIDRRNSENRYVRAKLSTMIKKFRKMLDEGKLDEAETYSREVFAYIDSACSKGVIHKNAAARKVGRLASALYKAKNPATETVVVEEKVEEPAKEKVEEVKAEPVTEKPAKATTKKAPAKKAEKTEAPAKEKTTTKKTTTKKAETTEEKPAKKTAAKKTTKKAE